MLAIVIVVEEGVSGSLNALLSFLASPTDGVACRLMSGSEQDWIIIPGITGSHRLDDSLRIFIWSTHFGWSIYSFCLQVSLASCCSDSLVDILTFGLTVIFCASEELMSYSAFCSTQHLSFIIPTLQSQRLCLG